MTAFNSNVQFGPAFNSAQISSEPAWRPAAGVVAHDGSALTGLEDFFSPPPATIGEVISCYSTLKSGRSHMSAAMRVLLCGGVGLVVAVLVMLLFHSTGGDRDRLVAVLVSFGLGLVAGLIAYVVTRFKHFTTYVGSKGIAQYMCRGSRDDVVEKTNFTFAAADELRTGQTRMYHNGVYTGTTYEFKWNDANGKVICTIKGQYHNKKGTPKTADLFNWAKSAELAWSHFILDRAQEELEKQGAITFRLDGGNFVRLGPGFMDLHQKGKDVRLSKAELANIKLGDGMFTVQQVGASKGFLGIGGAGYFSFNYSKMANARVFLIALDRLLGLRF